MIRYLCNLLIGNQQNIDDYFEEEVLKYYSDAWYDSKKNKVAQITKAQVKEIATLKMPDLNAKDIEHAMSMIEGTCRSMGVTVIE